MSEDIKVTDGTVLEALNGKVDIDFDNVASNSVSFARCSTEVTNCITEIPQRIKYELNEGTLTIKAGSVVIVPYGIEDLTAQYPKGATFINDNFKVYDTQFADGKFFVWAELVNDAIGSGAGTAVDRPIFVRIDENAVHGFVNVGSSTENYTGNLNYMLYKTDENVMKLYDTGKLTNWLYSLPLGVVTGNGTYLFNSINQVFNGIGYIGSTIWVDKGVKGLKTNGRNADGTLNSEEFTLNALQINNIFISSVNNSYYAIINGDDNIVSRSVVADTIYDKQNNYIYREDGQFKVGCIIAKASADTKGITSFHPKQPFRAVDYSDASGLGMPSSKYINLTLGSSGATYTAPANGYFYMRGKSSGTNQQIYMNNTNTTLETLNKNPLSSSYCYCHIPARRGDVVQVSYTITADLSFKFIYAEGEV